MKKAIQVLLIILIVLYAFAFLTGLVALITNPVDTESTESLVLFVSNLATVISSVYGLIVMPIALNKMRKATAKRQIIVVAVLVLLCSPLVGILMLVTSDRDYMPTQPPFNPYDPQNPYNQQNPYNPYQNPYNNNPYNNNPYNNPYGAPNPPYNANGVGQTPPPPPPPPPTYGVPFGTPNPTKTPKSDTPSSTTEDATSNDSSDTTL